MNKKSILIVAGGTAGHVFPALELAKEYIYKGENIIFVTDIRMYDLVVKTMFNFRNSVKVYSFMGRGFIRNQYLYNFKSLILLSFCLFQSIFLLLFNLPKITFGFGGFITVPPIIISKIFNVPIVLHEGNKVLGRANKFLLKKASKLTFSFKNIDEMPKRKKYISIGMPLRKEIEELYKMKYKITSKESLKILVTGGSLGAEVMALNIAKAISNLPIGNRVGIKVIQQVRRENIYFVENYYKIAKIDFKTSIFIEDIAECLSWCHVVICRCGAGTLAENLVSARPSIMVPLKSSVDNHQLKNALYIENIGAGWIIKEEELTNSSFLVKRLEKLLFDRNKLIKASNLARKHAKPGAAKRLVDLGDSLFMKNRKKNV